MLLFSNIFIFYHAFYRSAPIQIARKYTLEIPAFKSARVQASAVLPVV